MASQNFVELIVTCGSWQEAHKVADHLLQQKLVACVEMLEVQSKYWWKQQLEEAKEIKLIMESVAENFDKVDTAVAKLHSYETYVLQMLPIIRLSSAAADWLDETVN